VGIKSLSSPPESLGQANKDKSNNSLHGFAVPYIKGTAAPVWIALKVQWMDRPWW